MRANVELSLILEGLDFLFALFWPGGEDFAFFVDENVIWNAFACVFHGLEAGLVWLKDDGESELFFFCPGCGLSDVLIGADLDDFDVGLFADCSFVVAH